MAEKTKPEKKELTAEEKAANEKERCEGLLSVYKAIKSAPDSAWNAMKGKIPQKFIDEKLESKEIKQDFVDLLKKHDKIGVARVYAKGTAAEIPWRWKALKVDKESELGKELIQFETDLATLEEQYKDLIAVDGKIFKHEVKVNGTGKWFNTYFAKPYVKPEGAGKKGK